MPQERGDAALSHWFCGIMQRMMRSGSKAVYSGGQFRLVLDLIALPPHIVEQHIERLVMVTEVIHLPSPKRERCSFQAPWCTVPAHGGPGGRSRLRPAPRPSGRRAGTAHCPCCPQIIKTPMVITEIRYTASKSVSTIACIDRVPLFLHYSLPLAAVTAALPKLQPNSSPASKSEAPRPV